MPVQNIQNTQEYTTYCGGSTEVRAETPLDTEPSLINAPKNNKSDDSECFFL